MSLDLIDVDRARQNLPSAANADEPVLATLITAASRAVQRYCRRDFVQQTYDELYSGFGDRRLVLRQYPVLSVQSVRSGPAVVLEIMNSLANTPQARVEVLSTGLRLTRVTAGTTTTDTSVTWAGHATILAVQNAVNVLGNGWSATGQGYDQWPSADLYCPNGLSGSDGPLPAGQGALSAAGQYAGLRLHATELAGVQLDARRGWLLRAVPYTDPELLGPDDLVWPAGVNNVRVQYTAGYATVPEDVQEACALLVATFFKEADRNQNVAQEAVPGAYSLSRVADQFGRWPRAVRVLLAPYRNHRVLGGQE